MTLTVNGVEVPHLAAAHEHAHRTRPDTVSVVLEGENVFPHGVTWTYPAPTTIRGRRGLFSGGPDRGAFWLGWKNPAALTLFNVTIAGYERGGLDVDGGPVLVDHCQFRDLGADVCDDSRAGYAAVYTRSPVTVTRSAFLRIANQCSCKARHWAWMHAVYAVGPRARAAVDACTFTSVSGDPVRVRNAAAATVTACTSRRSGERALASSWHAPGERPGVAAVDDSNVLVAGGWTGQPVALWGPDLKDAA